MEIEFEDVVPVLGVVVVAIIPAIITLFLGYRRFEPRLRPRTSLKTDLEILKMINRKDAQHQYDVVRTQVDAMIAKIYEKPGGKGGHKKSRVSWPGFAFSFIVLVGFSFWSWYLVHDGFTWWVIGTGYGALISFAWVLISLSARSTPGRFEVEPESKL